MYLNVKYAVLNFQRIRRRDRSLKQDPAVGYLLMPERVKKLEGQILSLSNRVKDLRSDMHQLVQVLKEAADSKKYSLPMKDERCIS